MGPSWIQLPQLTTNQDNCGKSAAILIRESGIHYMFWGSDDCRVHQSRLDSLDAVEQQLGSARRKGSGNVGGSWIATCTALGWQLHNELQHR